jgi:hypothetical protein
MKPKHGPVKSDPEAKGVTILPQIGPEAGSQKMWDA